MRFLGRFSFAASYCLFSLTALSCHMASGVATKATDGDRDFASAAEEAAPPAAAIAGVAVDSDGSLFVRLASKDEEWHPGTFNDDGVRKHVVIGADGSLDGHTVDDITSADSAETGESMRFVRRKPLRSEELADGALVDEGSAGVHQHSKFDSDAAAMQTMTDKQTMIFILVLLIIIVLAVVLFLRFVGMKEMAPPPKPPPVVVVVPAQPQDTEAKSSASRQSPQSLEPAPRDGDGDEDTENRARLAGQRHASGDLVGSPPRADAEPASAAVGPTDSLNNARDERGLGTAEELESTGPLREEPAGPPRANAEPAAEAVGPTDSPNTKRTSRGSEKANAMKEPPQQGKSDFAGELAATGIVRKESAGPPPPEPGPLPKGEGEGPPSAGKSKAPAPPEGEKGEGEGPPSADKSKAPAPPEGEIALEGSTTPDDLNLHLAEGASLGFSTKGKGKGWHTGGRGSAAAAPEPKSRE